MSKDSHKTAVLGLGRCGGKIAAALAKIFSGSPIKIAAVDSDQAFLDSLAGVTKIATGSHRTDGLGCGENPKTGEKALRDDITLVKNFINGMGCVVVVGGLGKGFATGAAPVLAEVFNGMPLIPIFAVTTPFSIEGNLARSRAENAIEMLRDSAKNVIHISNDLLYSTLPADSDVNDAFNLADQAMTQGICALLDILKYEPADAVSLEFSTITEHIGKRQAECAMGYGSTEENNFAELAQKFIDSPLSGGENYIAGADAVMLKVTTSRFTAAETKECVAVLGERLKCASKVSFGFHFNPEATHTSVSGMIIKYNDLFMKGKPRAGKGTSQLELGLVQHNYGIFAGLPIKVRDDNGYSLDIPTFQRLGIELENI